MFLMNLFRIAGYVMAAVFAVLAGVLLLRGAAPGGMGAVILALAWLALALIADNFRLRARLKNRESGPVPKK